MVALIPTKTLIKYIFVGQRDMNPHGTLYVREYAILNNTEH